MILGPPEEEVEKFITVFICHGVITLYRVLSLENLGIESLVSRSSV